MKNPTANVPPIVRRVQSMIDGDCRIDVADGLYWYCAHHSSWPTPNTCEHRGQSSRLYSVLGRIGYRPGANESDLDPSDEAHQAERGGACMVYEALRLCIDAEGAAESIADWLDATGAD